MWPPGNLRQPHWYANLGGLCYTLFVEGQPPRWERPKGHQEGALDLFVSCLLQAARQQGFSPARLSCFLCVAGVECFRAPTSATWDQLLALPDGVVTITPLMGFLFGVLLLWHLQQPQVSPATLQYPLRSYPEPNARTFLLEWGQQDLGQHNLTTQ